MNAKNNQSKHRKVLRTSLLLLALVAFLVLTLESAIALDVTKFDTNQDKLTFIFPSGGESHPYSITLPNGTITKASMMIEGFDVEGKKATPADVMIVTDVSGSMKDDCDAGTIDEPDNEFETPCKINDAKNAAIGFLNQVVFSIIHVGLVSYSDWVNTIKDSVLTTDKNSLTALISKYKASGSTNIGGAIDLANIELTSARARSGARKYIILLTDGNAKCFIDTDGQKKCASGQSGLDQGAAFAKLKAQDSKNNNIIIYAISFGVDANRDLMKQIASITNGQEFFAPDASTLQTIYKQIAQEITVTEFPTPKIKSTAPISLAGWKHNTQYSGDYIWNDADCGGIGATCPDYRALLQQNLDKCTTYPCKISFSASSSTIGRLDLSDLLIHLNEPPVGNAPPLGSCRFEALPCVVDANNPAIVVNLDDGSMVADPDNANSQLDWKYTNSVKSPTGAFYTFSNNYNSTRKLPFFVDSNHLNGVFWETFFFSITDPPGATTSSCINLSYQGCGLLKVKNDKIGFDQSKSPYQYDLDALIEIHSTKNNDGKLSFEIQGLANGISDCFQFTAPDAASRTSITPLDLQANCTETIEVQVSDEVYASLGTHIANLTINYTYTNQPPKGNAPPLGQCRREAIKCPQTSKLINIDDKSMVNDPDNAPNELNWAFDFSIESQGGAFLGFNNNYNDTRQLTFSVDISHLNEIFWEAFFFNVSDPFAESTLACANITYEGCGILKVKNDFIQFNDTQQPFDYDLNSLIAAYNVAGNNGNLSIEILGLANGASNCFIFTVPDILGHTKITASNAKSNCTEVIKVQASDKVYPTLGTHIANLTINYIYAPPTLDIDDRTVSFTYSSFPGYKYNLSGMVSDLNFMPCQFQDVEFTLEISSNFLVDGPEPKMGIITIAPNNPDWTTGTSETIQVDASCSDGTNNYVDTARLTMVYTATDDPPNGKITCKSSIPSFLLPTDIFKNIPFTSIFDFSGNYGSINKLIEDSSSSIDIVPQLPTGIDAKSSGLASSETVNIAVRTSIGVASSTCPVKFSVINTNCNKAICNACATYGCFVDNGCIDKVIPVLNKGTTVRTLSIVPASILLPYTVKSYLPLSSGFVITPIDPKNQRFAIDGSGLAQNYRDIGLMELDFGSLGTARVCTELIRVTYEIGEGLYDPESELLISGSKAVTGYFESDGAIFSKGPYIFTAKVWLRR